MIEALFEEFLVGFFFIIGLGIGSFLNVAVLRGIKGENFFGRSYCDNCKKNLSWRELIPVFSFILQKRRCRSCGIRLFWQYPIVEFITGLGFALTAWWVFSFLAVSWRSLLVLFEVLLALSAATVILAADIKFYIIPNGASLALLISGIFLSVTRAYGNPDFGFLLLYDIGSALLFSLFFASLWLVSKGKWIGLGDAKLMLASSVLIGFPQNTAGFVFSFWAGSAGALFLLIIKRKNLRDIIPFGPYILFGFLAAFFWGEQFITLTGLAEFICYLP